jgi:precorrin-2 dehydrogenase/sirohydrochlorin ferrochelatase
MPVMRYYPVNLDVQNRGCLVVGGGAVGERKVKTLLECGARVTVIAPLVTEPLRGLASEDRIRLKVRAYQPSDPDGQFLVIGATGDEEVNRQISEDASGRGILCNIADCPKACTFVLPAIVSQGDLVIAISTSNKSPAVAKRIRQALEKEFGPEYATLLKVMGAIRERLLAQAKSPESHKQKFERLLDEGLLEMIREERTQEVSQLLQDALGEGYTWEELMRTDQGSEQPCSV